MRVDEKTDLSSGRSSLAGAIDRGSLDVASSIRISSDHQDESTQLVQGEEVTSSTEPTLTKSEFAIDAYLKLKIERAEANYVFGLSQIKYEFQLAEIEYERKLAKLEYERKVEIIDAEARAARRQQQHKIRKSLDKTMDHQQFPEKVDETNTNDI